MQDAEDGKQPRAAYGYVDGNRYRRISKCIRCNPSGDSFQNATRWMLMVSQFFGIMPLIGVVGFSRKSQRQHPSFSWRSPNAIYTILLITVSAVETSLCVFQIFKTGFFFGNFGALTFYLLAFVSRTLCFNLALNWPKVLRYWRATEHIFLELPYTSPAATKSRSVSLAIRTNVTFGFFIFLTLMEHFVYNLINMSGVKMGQERCNSSRSIVELFLRSQRGHLFRFIGYRHWMAPFLIWFNICFTYTGSYLDILIIVTGWAFIMRFNQITDRLQLLEPHVLPETIWMQIRQHYAMLHELLLIMDAKLSLIILVCSASNLYFICLQLFNAINHFHWDVLWQGYQIYSVLFSVTRFFTVLMVASTIRDASQKPLKFIYKVASTNWNVELTRFSQHIRTGRLALSGRGLFYFTRQLVLTLLGTVITYELVMLDAVNDRGQRIKIPAMDPFILISPPPPRCNNGYKESTAT